MLRFVRPPTVRPKCRYNRVGTQHLLLVFNVKHTRKVLRTGIHTGVPALLWCYFLDSLFVFIICRPWRKRTMPPVKSLRDQTASLLLAACSLSSYLSFAPRVPPLCPDDLVLHLTCAEPNMRRFDCFRSVPDWSGQRVSEVPHNRIHRKSRSVPEQPVDSFR